MPAGQDGAASQRAMGPRQMVAPGSRSRHVFNLAQTVF